MGKIVKLLERYVQWIALAAGAVYMVYMAYAYLGSEIKLTAPPLYLQLDGAIVPPGEVDQMIVAKAVVPLEAAMKATKDTVVSVDPASSSFTVSRVDEVDRTRQNLIKFKVNNSTTIGSAKINWLRVRTIQNSDKLAPGDQAYLATAKAAALHLDDLKPGALVTVDTGNVQTSDGAPILAMAVTLESPIVENVQSDYDKRLDEQKADLTALALNTSGAYQPPGVGPIDDGPKPPPPTGIVKLPVPPAPMPPTAAAKTYYTRWTVTMTGPPDAAGKPTRKDMPYFCGVFTINSPELTKEMNDSYAAVPNRAPNMLDPQFSRVYLLREEWVNGKWSAPKVIDPLPVNALQPYPGDTGHPQPITNEKEKQDWFIYKNWMEGKGSQSLILDPQFYPEPNDVTKVTRPGKIAGAQPGAGAGRAANPAQVPPVVNGGVAAPIVNNDREILVYDATVEEGKTYRYAVRYRLLNAVFDHKQTSAKPPDIDTIFDVRSFPDPTNEGEPKAPAADVEKLWTEPITIEPTAQIFVTKVNSLGNQTGPIAQFAVFIWKDGHWKQFNSKPVNPGDPVNAPAVAGKPSTGWTVVDVRKDPHVIGGGNAGEGTYVLIMDDHGAVTPRDVQSDAANPDFARLKALASGAPAAALGPGAPSSLK